jgi:hypothetical protein
MTTSTATSTSQTTFTSAFDRLAAGVMVASSGLILASTLADYVIGSPAAAGALGIVGAALLAAVAPGITRPLQARMPRVAAVLTTVFAYGFVVGGVAFNLETILVADGMPSLDALSVFPVIGMSGVLGPLSLVAIGVALAVSGTARAAGSVLVLSGMLFPISRIGDIPMAAIAVDGMLVLGMTMLAWGLVRTPIHIPAARQPVAA